MPELGAVPGLLAGCAAVVAGGGGAGIGAAVSRILAASGAAVLVVDIDPSAARKVCDQIAADGGRAVPLVADLLESASADAIVRAALEAFGRIDVLATVAGGMTAHAEFRPLAEWSEADWDKIVSLNLRYVFLLSRAVIPVMIRQGGGSIVNVTSISGVFGAPRHAPYGAAKAGLIHLTRSLCLEYGPQGIRANAVSPGAVETPATDKAMAGAQRSHVSAVTPLRRAGAPEDIARAVLFFASPLAAYISGQMLLVDGGASVIFPLGTPGQS